MNTEEGNKLIASFMGGEIISADEKVYEHFVFDEISAPPFYYISDRRKWEKRGKSLTANAETFQYHSSWDWLMPVVEKIRNDHYFEIEFYGDYTRANVVYETGVEGFHISKWLSECSSIEVVWVTVINYITWYNTIQPKT